MTTIPHIIWKTLTAITLTASSIASVIPYHLAVAQVTPQTQATSRFKLTLSGHTAPLRTIALSKNGQILASTSDDKTIKLWNPKTGELISTINEQSANGIRGLAIFPDGQTILGYGYGNTIKLWNATTGKVIRTVDVKSDVYSVVIASDGETIISGSADNQVKFWNSKNGQRIRTWKANAYSLAISSDGKTLFTGGENGGIVRLRNTKTGKILRTFIPPKPKNPIFENQMASSVSSLAISPDGQYLVTGGYDDSFQSIPQTDGKNIKVWNLRTGKLAHNFSIGASVNALVISPDSKAFVTGGLGWDINLWDFKTGKVVNTLKGHGGGIYGLAFSRDGKTLFSGSGDKSIKAWQLSP
ncbi:MAG: WD40 repeat domain-containing protein [Scytonematopsis contorta HA4267-MV1]|jgi:WD40 repeat protein|nr:WD40 repeat domain-containing protein [Scytonematopsis contorta HA4267-MV1]